MRTLTVILLAGLLASVTALAADPALPGGAGDSPRRKAGVIENELILQDGQWVKAPAPAEGTPAGELALIRRDLDKGDHAAAVEGAEGFLKRYPGDPLREEAISLAADAEIRRRNYWAAYNLLEDQLAEFPNGDLRDRALDREIEVAQAFLAGAKKRVGKVLVLPAVDDGIEILERVAERSPASDRAELALLAIADHYFNKTEWADAAAQYDAFIKLYPKSHRATYARLRAADAFHRAYRGPEYDVTPLNEAEQRYKAFAAAFPAEAAEAHADAILNRIRSQKAAHELTVAEFYERTGRASAARTYYRMVAGEYPDTPSGRTAAARAGHPALPGGAIGSPLRKEGVETNPPLPRGAITPPEPGTPERSDETAPDGRRGLPSAPEGEKESE